ncbi:MAG: hemerythrin domain-containing protein, partial [Rhizomicrobium sp.]
MSLMHWNENLSVGVDSIDADHKKLVGMVNDLFDGVKEGKGIETVGHILDGLIAYTVEHFDREERYFAQTSY